MEKYSCVNKNNINYKMKSANSLLFLKLLNKKKSIKMKSSLKNLNY